MPFDLSACLKRLGAIGFCLCLNAVGAQAQSVAAPHSFEALAVSPTEIRCYWLPAKGASGYRIMRDGAPLTDLPATAQEYDDTGLTPDSTHSYSVVTLQAGHPSKPSNYVERTFALFPEQEEKGRGKREEGRERTIILPFPKGKGSGVWSEGKRKGEEEAQVSFDMVVVQASSGGVAAAVEAARRGLRVALIEPTTRIGGMPANGLSATDLRRSFHADGFLVRFRDRVSSFYAEEGIKADGLAYSPGMAQRAMKSLLYEQTGITLYRRTRLAKVITEPGAEEGRRRVTAVVIEELNADGQPTGRRAELNAKAFIDATDCGDLAAWASAPFRVGREARSKREPHNGLIYYDRASDKSLPGSTGKADHRIQSYAYLLTVKDYGPGADKTIPVPPGYRKEEFIHSPAWRESWAVTSGRMPDGKYELNQHPQGNDLQAINYGYPNADYNERARIEKLYHDHILCYLYYIQTEQGQKRIGLPDDEYRDSGGFPPLLYVREGRRILGEQLPDETDITDARSLIRPESIGIGDYPMDSHAVRPKTDWTTPDMGEGEWWLYKYTPWHSLPIGILIPRMLDNVWVTTAVSSTHVSFGTYRLEPVRMTFGEAAAAAAALSIRYHLIARDVPARQVQDELLPDVANPAGDPNTVLQYFTDVPPGSRNYREIQYLAARGFASDQEKFEPDAPTTRKELVAWLTVLASRAAPPPRVVDHEADADGTVRTLVQRAYFPYMGPSIDPEAVRELKALAEPERVVTRAEGAHWLARIMDWKPDPTAAQDRYGDVTDPPTRADTAALAAHFIDSGLWDGPGAPRIDGKQAFHPDAPIRHSELFEALYLAQLGLGPLFNDNPVDGRNGRTVPSAITETVEKPSQ